MLAEGADAGDRGVKVRAGVRLALAASLLDELKVGRAVAALAPDRVDDRPLTGEHRGRPEVNDDRAGADLGGGVDRPLDRVDGEGAIGRVGRGEPVAPAGAPRLVVYGDRAGAVQAGDLDVAGARLAAQLD